MISVWCRYQIKDATKPGWFHCLGEEGHAGPHIPPMPSLTRGDRTQLRFEGDWHLPESRSEEPAQ